MAAGLVDSNIIIEILRSHSPAEQWLETQSYIGISRGVYFEVYEGVSNKRELQAANKLLNRLELIEYTTSDLQWATAQLATYWLSHGVDGYDCMIAAPSHRLQLPLYTRNLKHFTPLLGELAEQPY